MSDLRLLLSAGSYSANALAVATALVGVSILLLGCVVVLRGRGKAAAFAFFILTFVGSGWLGSAAAMYATVDADVALRWARLGYLFSSLMPAGVFHFAATMVPRSIRNRRLSLFFWVLSSVFALTGFATELMIPSVRHFPWGFYPRGRPFYGVIILCFAAMLIAAIKLLNDTYRNAEGPARERAGALLLGFILGSLAMFDYLPAVGIALQPMGHVAALAFVILSAAAVWRFELADITPAFAAGQILETMKGAVIVADMSGIVRVVNRAAASLLGYSAHQLRGLHLRDVFPRDQNMTTGQLLNSLGILEHTMAWRAADGTTVDVLASSSFLRDHDGTTVAVVYVASDFTERKKAEQALRESEHRYRLLFEERKASEARYRLLFERNLAGVYRTTIDGRILECNDACARIFGYETREEILAAEAGDSYVDETERDRLVQILREQGQLNNVEVRLRRRDGTVVWVLENVALLEGDILEGTIIDITDRKVVQEQMEYQAFHDALTGLPNRLLFRDRITVALAHARRSGGTSAVMFLDLDQFKHVNDTLGHTIGDRLLQAIAARLVTCVRAEDTVARMGGDEFTILLADIPDRRHASTVAQKILDAVRHPVIVGEHELFVSTSIGIAVLGDDGDDAETLLKNADRAMYRAKEMGRDTFQYAAAAKLEIANGRFALERSLHQALQRGELVLHYQPMVEIATGKLVGAEALLRWMHPVNGLMAPDDFIPIAEETQLIVPVGAWVLRTACTQMKAWHDAGHPWLRVAVNLSPRQFQDRELVSTVERILAETGFPAAYLDLEITESTAMQNAEVSLAILTRLKEMGIRISIDDFGTGYSSLSYLKRFPIDTVKIDQDFLRELTRDDAAIISAMISMARALNLRVVAEGVETQEQFAFLRGEQCAEMQGFLYSEPLDAVSFEQTLRDRGTVAHGASFLERLRLTPR